MATGETKTELIEYLDRMTREVSVDSFPRFSTATIASELNISRNLASQYLNDFVREGVVVKVGARPVLYFHRAGFERYFQRQLKKGEYASFAELFDELGIHDEPNFERAIGHDRSLGTCVTQLKAAVKYPPSGLPVLMVGESGTGKTTLARLAHLYGIDEGVIDAAAEFAPVDCSLYVSDDEGFRRAFIGDGSAPGLASSEDGGVVYLKHLERLPHASQEVVISWLHSLDSMTRGGISGAARTPRLIVSVPPDADPELRERLAHLIPIVVSVPALRDRTEDERTDLIMHFLRFEGRRVGANVAISRGALRHLMEADFRDNIDGLRACIRNCCAESYLDHNGERLIIRNWSLPSSVLGSSAAQEDDDKLVSGDKVDRSGSYVGDRLLRYFSEVESAWEAYRSGESQFKDFVSSATATMELYQDFLSFERHVTGARVATYESVLSGVVEAVNSSYNIEISRKCARVLAQSLSLRVWDGIGGASWRQQESGTFSATYETLVRAYKVAAAVTAQVEAGVRSALGLELDAASRVMLFLEINEVVESSEGRSCLGVVICHGYSTATSIADAANRLLHRRVYEAVDLTYDDSLQDLVAPLGRLLGKYAHCRTVVLLVDTGSLADVDRYLSGMTDADLYVVSNVSTGLALEVGASIAANEDLRPVLDACTDACAPRYRVITGTRGEGAIVFCSETGPDAADKVRRLFESSLPRETSVQLVTGDYADLARNGADSLLLSRYDVRAIVGTVDPGIEGVPFVPLDELLFEGSSEQIDRALAADLGREGIRELHANLLKNLTLSNVIESITILNPEALFAEVDRAIRRLEEHSAEKITARMTTGLYVHLCCLVERLVTRTPIECYPDEEAFVREHAEFVAQFRESFADICRRYRVEVPVSEIAYVYTYIRGMSDAQAMLAGGGAGEDE